MYKKVGIIFEDATNTHTAAYYSLVAAMANQAELIIMAKTLKNGSQTCLIYKNRIEKFISECEERNINIKTVHYEQLTLNNIEHFVKNEDIDIVFLPLDFDTIKNSRKLQIVINKIKKLTDVKFAIVKAVHMVKIHHSKVVLVLDKKISPIKDWGDFIFSLSELFLNKLTLMYLTKEKEDELPETLSKLVHLSEKNKIYIEKLILKGISGKKINLEAALRNFDLIVMGISKRSTIKTIFFGNLMLDVLRESPCNVIVFKT